VSHPSNSAPAAVAEAASPARPRRGLWRFGRFLRARVGVERLQVDLLAGRGQPRLLASVFQPYATAGTERAAPTELADTFAAFAPALAQLQERLDAEIGGGVRGLACDVVIDDSWMLYDVVRADLRGLSPGAADALVGASLADVAGVAAEEIASRWQPQGRSAYTLACGLAAGALPALREALDAAGVALGSIEGEFVAEYNRMRGQLDPGCAVIALVRDAGTQLAVMVDGVLTAMSFEYGVGAARELELRGRSLLRVAGIGREDTARFFVLSPPGGKAPEPWVALPRAA